MATVSVERDEHVLLVGLNRLKKRNAFTLEMLADLSRAYALLESDDSLATKATRPPSRGCARK